MNEHLALPLYMKAIKANVEEVSSKTEALGYAVCDSNKDFLTDSLPKVVCKELVSICNKHYYNTLKMQNKNNGHGNIIFSAVVPLEPMERPVERVIVKNRQGNLETIIPKVYAKYLNDFYRYTFDNELFMSVKIPIEEKIQVTGYFYTAEKDNKCIAAYVEALLDCLLHSCIIKSKDRYTVNNTDNSRVFTDSSNPRIEVVIRKWGND